MKFLTLKSKEGYIMRHIIEFAVISVFVVILNCNNAYCQTRADLLATAAHRCKTDEKTPQDVKRCKCGVVSFFTVLGADRTKEGKTFLKTAAREGISEAINYFISQANDTKLQIADIYLRECMSGDYAD